MKLNKHFYNLDLITRALIDFDNQFFVESCGDYYLIKSHSDVPKKYYFEFANYLFELARQGGDL